MVSGDCRQRKAVCRGGPWINNGRNLRSAYRNNWHIDNDNNGFRLARARVAAGWRIRTRQHPVTTAKEGWCEKQGCRGVSRHIESPPAIVSFFMATS